MKRSDLEKLGDNMLKNTKNRRQFLVGMGGCLVAIPFLPSMLSRKALAQIQNDPVNRLITFLTPHFTIAENFHPQNLNLSHIPHSYYDISEAMFKNISGPFSKSLNESIFHQLREKILIIDGVHYPVRVGNDNHPKSFALGASGSDNGIQETSLDAQLMKSNLFYPSGYTGRKFTGIEISPYESTTKNNMSYIWTGSQVEKLSQFRDPKAIFNYLFGGVTNKSVVVNQQTVDLELSNKKLLVDNILDSYKSVKSHKRIGTEDKRKLDQHVQSLFEIQTKIQSKIDNNSNQAPQTISCQPPNEPQSNISVNEKIDIVVDMLALAIGCDLTRVASVYFNCGINEGYGEFHSKVHPSVEDRKNKAQTDARGDFLMGLMVDFDRYFAKYAGKLLQKLDSMQDPLNEGSLLDNSLFYWTSMHGHNDVYQIWDDSHDGERLRTFIAGGAGGKIQTGKYINYGHTFQNQVLVTMAKALGHPVGTKGIGDYGETAEKYKLKNYDKFTSIVANKSTPLPRILKP
ncbi:MAG: hypothetical protein CME66_08480 [Halobacteriovoraceae bacterium]|jgi:hypothetical protein|nr:hypothetical protein [Halobacteriovoraceae bacterium]